MIVKLKLNIMFKPQIKFNLVTILVLGLFLASCTKEEEAIDVENYGFVESYEIQKNLNAGIHGCVELVFPVSLLLPDSTTIVIESFEDGKVQLQAWKEANPDVEGRPHIVFPVEIITQEGEVVSVESRQEIRRLIRDCRDNFPPKPRHFKACFKLEFPVSLSFPDDSEVEVANRMEMKKTLRAWKRDNPDAKERPGLVYPVTIVYEDGSLQEIANKDELAAAKKACRE